MSCSFFLFVNGFRCYNKKRGYLKKFCFVRAIDKSFLQCNWKYLILSVINFGKLLKFAKVCGVWCSDKLLIFTFNFDEV